MTDATTFLAHETGNTFQLEYGDLDSLPEVMSVMTRSFPGIYGEAWNNVQSRSMLCLPGVRLLLARTDNQLCGFAFSRAVAGEEELLLIAVDPDHRNKGVGSLLLNRIKQRALSENIEAIFLEVRSENPAEQLYRKHGFEKIGSRAKYYTGSDKSKHDANTYRLSLRNIDQTL